MDVDSLVGGTDWERRLRDAVSRASAVITVIGKDWAETPDAAGHRRLDDPDDVLRREIATALATDVDVIPVLVGGARMPSRDELPEDLKGLPGRQAVELRDDHWRSDAKRLVAAAGQTLPLTERMLHPVPGGKWAAAAALLALVVVGGWLLLRDGGSTQWTAYESPAYHASYPEDWSVSSDYQPYDEDATVLRTVFTSPDGAQSVLIDHIPGETTAPRQKANEIEAATRRSEGSDYRRILFEGLTIGDQRAWQWTFDDGEDRKVDYFLQLDGNGFAVLGEADASEFQQIVPVARRIAESIQPSS